MDLETHFKNIDLAKNLLFNAVTKEQEERARRTLQNLKNAESVLEI